MDDGDGSAQDAGTAPAGVRSGGEELSRYRRSPHLVVEWDGDAMVLVHCDTLRRFRVDERLLAVLSALEEPVTHEELAATGAAVSAEDLEALVALGVVETASEANGGLPASYWNTFDLAVQRHQNAGGFRESELPPGPPPPATKARPPGPSTALPRPGELPGALGEVLARRRSVRTYCERPLALGELSNLLHHSARVTGSLHDPVLGEHAFRPFASGGARGELELYVVANDVEGLPPGAHYYDPRAHDLVLVRDRDEHQDVVNRWVAAATGGALNREPAAVVLVTAVFGRVMWKYGGIGLAVIYRNVGCLYQNLYLVATALDLAPCGIGAGPERANAAWLGLDPLVESQVGAFLVGPPAPGAPSR